MEEPGSHNEDDSRPESDDELGGHATTVTGPRTDERRRRRDDLAGRLAAGTLAA